MLLGKVNPSGRLPVTVYLDRYTSIQVTYIVKLQTPNLQHNTNTMQPMESMDMVSFPGRSYRYATDGVLLPFGHGLSYTTFRYSSFTLGPITPGPRPPLISANATVVITNTGAMQAPYLKPQTPNPKSQTPNPKPQIPHHHDTTPQGRNRDPSRLLHIHQRLTAEVLHAAFEDAGRIRSFDA